jgi:hypothetical protein
MNQTENDWQIIADKPGLISGFLAAAIVTFVAPALIVYQERAGLFFHGDFTGGWSYKSILMLVVAFFAFGFWLFSSLYGSWTFYINRSGIFQKKMGKLSKIQWDSLLLVVLNQHGVLQFYSKDTLIKLPVYSIKNKQSALEKISEKCNDRFCYLHG